MKNNNLKLGFLVFLFGGLIGTLTTLNSWNGMVYFYISDQRAPAAIQKNFDFTNLHGSALLQVSKERLIQGADITVADKQVGISLGNYLVSNSEGQKQFACNVYSTINLTFQAEGMAESGQIPSMNVSGPCLVSGDLNKISALWIPYQKILQEPAGDLDLSFFDRNRLEISFTHIGTEWPMKWKLSEVFLKGHNSKVKISPRELKKLTHAPLYINWLASK